MEYVFYFDESFHDRKVTIDSNGKLNILEDKALDNYIGVFWGCQQKSLHRNIALLEAFEVEQKRIYGLSEDEELKSTTLGKKNFKYGIYSFNRDALFFYHQLFSLICTIKPIIQINAISKMEFFIRKTFEDMVFPTTYAVDKNNFYYSLTKFFIFYGHTDLVKAMYDVESSLTVEDLRKQLLFTLDAIINATKDIARKELECAAFRELRQILVDSKFDVNVSRKLDFRYYPNFDGLCSLLYEIDINLRQIKLTLDNEEKTYSEAQGYPFGKIKCANSKNVIQLHLSDFISGFMGRMMYALSNDSLIREDKITDIRSIGDNDLIRKRILSPQWFDISEKQFELYILVYKALIENHQHYWTIMTMSYSDQVVSFCALIRYFAGFNDFSSFKSVKPNLHSEYYNSQCCDDISKHYS